MRIFGAACFFAHVLLPTVLGLSMRRAADQTTEKQDEFSLFGDLQQQITDLKIQMSKVIKDKAKCEAEIKSLQTRFEKETAETQNFEQLYLADRTEIKSLAKKILAIESMCSRESGMMQPSTEPSEGQGLNDTDLSEIRNTLDSLQVKVDTLDRQVSGIDSKVFFAKSCDALLSERSQKNRTIYPNGRYEPGIGVLCDFETEGGRWTIIQKRDQAGPRDEFSRDEFFTNWTEYENGFGSLDGNFWIGLKTIHALTKDGDRELRIDSWNYKGVYAYAKYSNFSISDSSDFYRLYTSGYFRSAEGDSLYLENGTRFSTKDKDNDDRPEFNCASSKGGWWYKNCDSSHGFYFDKETQDTLRCVMHWFTGERSFHCLRQVQMKIRSRR